MREVGPSTLTPTSVWRGKRRSEGVELQPTTITLFPSLLDVTHSTMTTWCAYREGSQLKGR